VKRFFRKIILLSSRYQYLILESSYFRHLELRVSTFLFTGVYVYVYNSLADIFQIRIKRNLAPEICPSRFELKNEKSKFLR